MNEIEALKLSEENFNRYSLLSFNRHQIVKECWKKDGEWGLLPVSFVEEWNEHELESFAESILEGISKGKMITYGATRDEAIIKMKRALGEFAIGGVKTNIDFQYDILNNKDFVKGNYDTSFIEEKLVRDNA